VWKDTSIRNTPIFLAVGPGSDPKALATERVIGKTTPPPRAVSDGMNGASTRSAAASEYPKRKGVRPKRSINPYPTRAPNPVCVTARENRNAVNTSHTVTLPNPASTRAGVSVPVNGNSVMASSTLTPMRTGCAIAAMMVATKIANRRPCAWFIPGGTKKYSRTPGASTTAQRHHSPCGMLRFSRTG
jgi:hypothetical protein